MARDGEHKALVLSFSADAIGLDPVEIFFGADAEAAAAEDGELPPEGLPNPFYLRNPDPSPVRLTVAPEFEAALLEHTGLQQRTVDAVTLHEIYTGEVDSSWWLFTSLAPWPATLTVRDGVVVRAEELYLP